MKTVQEQDGEPVVGGFRKGDRVRCVEEDGTVSLGTVVLVDPRGVPPWRPEAPSDPNLFIEWDDEIGDRDFYFEHQLDGIEHHTEDPT